MGSFHSNALYSSEGQVPKIRKDDLQQTYDEIGRKANVIALPPGTGKSLFVKRMVRDQMEQYDSLGLITNTVRSDLEIPIRRQFFDAIASGRKTVEGRIHQGKFTTLTPGKRIIFVNGKDRVGCLVSAVRHYDSFESMLRGEGWDNCLPDAPSEREAIAIESLPGYKQRASQHGVVAIELQKESPVTESGSHGDELQIVQHDPTVIPADHPALNDPQF